MIKRDGVAVMNARSKNVAIAKETLEILKNGCYTAPSGKVVDISNDLEAALAGTVLYQKDIPLTDYTPQAMKLEVVNETTAQAAARLIAAGKQDIVALNFASARNPGGGFLAGALAQEEDLSRGSGLYPCVKSKPVFYNENILCDSTFYTDNVIYSPKVPFFRDRYNLFLEDPFLLSIISAPAPNIRSMTNVDEEELSVVFQYRIAKVLQIAELYKHSTLILGAWGCGAFGNSPELVANAFMDTLLNVPCFEHVCFATYDDREPPVVYETFKKIVEAGF